MLSPRATTKEIILKIYETIIKGIKILHQTIFNAEECSKRRLEQLNKNKTCRKKAKQEM